MKRIRIAPSVEKMRPAGWYRSFVGRENECNGDVSTTTLARQHRPPSARPVVLSGKSLCRSLCIRTSVENHPLPAVYSWDSQWSDSVQNWPFLCIGSGALSPTRKKNSAENRHSLSIVRLVVLLQGRSVSLAPANRAPTRIVTAEWSQKIPKPSNALLGHYRNSIRLIQFRQMLNVGLNHRLARPPQWDGGEKIRQAVVHIEQYSVDARGTFVT